MAVEGFQSVVVADDDQVAVAAGFGRRDRDAHLAVEGGVDRVARFQRQVYALMLAPTAHTELRTDGGLVGIVVAFERVDQLDVHRTRQVGELHHVAVGKEFGRVPAAGVDFAVLDVVAVAEVFPCVVVEQDDHHCVVARRERVDGDHPVDVFGRFDRLRLFPRFERLGLLLFEAVDLLLDLLQEFAHVVDALGLQGRGRAGEKKGGEKITQFHRVCVLVSLNQN